MPVLYHLKDLILKKSVKSASKITYADIVKETGVSRSVLVRMASRKGFSVTVETVEKLCRYFDCSCDDLMTIIPDTQVRTEAAQEGANLGSSG